jgi:hypothetical protein
METDLMEWQEGPVLEAPVAVELDPFEIRTYRIRCPR